MTKSGVAIRLLAMTSGLAALSWEVIWQIKSTLALGVSAWGTALTLSVTMGGMSLGSLAMGRSLRDRQVARPLRIYGLLECLIGIAGILIGPAFRVVEAFDTWAYTAMTGSAGALHLLGVISSIGISAICMGATLPVLGLVARRFQASIAVLYGLNTVGAAAGALLAAFFLIPMFGIAHVIWILATINFVVGISAWGLDSTDIAETMPSATKSGLPPQLTTIATIMTVIVSGFATFSLEVAWFRSLTAAFMSTTDAFAIMLACVLVSLGAGAGFVRTLKRRQVPLGTLLGAAGISILLATPVIERFDLFTYTMAEFPLIVFLQWFFGTLAVIGLPVALLGLALPWLLDDQRTPRGWGMLYGVNALAAIAGALGAAWIFLPTIGFARTAWLTGLLVVCTGALISSRQRRLALGAVGMAALLIAVVFESGVGRTRVQGTHQAYGKIKPPEVIESHEGPDVTASVVEYAGGKRALFIDGFSTASQGDESLAEHYMAWMGHLPMLLHPDPRNALVICFGTGQTANAVRRENPESLDIVDINSNVLKLAHDFSANEDVLADPRVRVTVMDGRAYIRRTGRIYDVITLEPMPPNFAGVNALYSQEFYRLARKKLSPGGVIAQWLPFHLLDPRYGASIAKTFQSVFPNAILWVDPRSTTGILIGSATDSAELGKVWPGFTRTALKRDLSEDEVRKAVRLDREALRGYGSYGEIISDDNQLLAYGKAAQLLRAAQARSNDNREFLDAVIAQASSAKSIVPEQNTPESTEEFRRRRTDPVERSKFSVELFTAACFYQFPDRVKQQEWVSGIFSKMSDKDSKQVLKGVGARQGTVWWTRAVESASGRGATISLVIEPNRRCHAVALGTDEKTVHAAIKSLSAEITNHMKDWQVIYLYKARSPDNPHNTSTITLFNPEQKTGIKILADTTPGQLEDETAIMSFYPDYRPE